MGGFGPWVRAAGGRVLGGGVQELAGDGRVADGGGVVEAEHSGQVEGVGAAGEGFFELTVGVQALKGGGEAAAGLVAAGWSGWRRFRGRWPVRTPVVGSRKMVPVFLQWLDRDRRAVRVWRRRLGGRGVVAAMTSAVVTSRRWA